ncbi:YceI family protein [Pontibacter sp. JH31]|uniref:YceI family protein n=1 Tax=Pontibacter aquaedesilientis TaxID=2766980 RepID=A0ABR7XJL9_9BACT|nr:YceI family protein [Pontibacter aquaedesilientis]MBD1398131.1 YceI family protein [Pontibacter aquaedesilientis]
MRHDKTYPLYTLLWAMLALTGMACDTTVKTDEAEVGAAVRALSPGVPDQVFTIDTAKSTVTWIGAKVTGRHNGVIPIKEGQINLHNGIAHGGRTVFDMTAVCSTDKTIDEAGNKKLTGHLRSEEFFDVAQHPTASFVITSIVFYDSTERQEVPSTTASAKKMRIKNPTHKITGNLTIKGITKSVSFPALITQEDSLLRAKANFNIDRTEWKLNYGADKSLGNKTIYPAVNIGLDLVARPK